MLSEHEYQKIQWQLQHIPKEIQGKDRANLRQRLKRKIKEHEYTTTYNLFEPLPYIRYFINRIINEQALRSLIKAATTSTEFTLDTESVYVYGEGNIPALIQIQIIIPHKLSLVMIIEMHHLPRELNPIFLLIKELIRIVFSSEKSLYIFGSKEELLPFIKFNLFTKEQFDLMEPINLQDEFKRFWHEQHPHQPVNPTANNTIINTCRCETCLGRNPSNPWSLQDCVAFELEEYLPKIHSNSNFDIGLDPQLCHRNSNELQHRQQLTTYAYNDCLAMQSLINKMKNKKFKFKRYSKIYDRIDILELSPVSSNDDSIFPHISIEPNRTITIIQQDKQKTNSYEQTLSSDKEEEYSINPIRINRSELKTKNPLFKSSTPSTKNEIPSHINNNKKAKIINWKLQSSNNNSSTAISTDKLHSLLNVACECSLSQPISTINTTTTIRHSSTKSDYDRKPLTDIERKQIHNRAATCKQRRRYYRNEIILHNIDNRFTYTQIKIILKQLNIPVKALLKSTSPTTNRTSLFIGIHNASHIRTYEHATSCLFTLEHYNELKHNQRQQNQRRQEHQREIEHGYEMEYLHERQHKQ